MQPHSSPRYATVQARAAKQPSEARAAGRPAIALLLIVGILLTIVPQANALTVTEGFETYTFPNLPTPTAYSYSNTGGVLIDSTNFNSGAKSLQSAGATSSGTSYFNFNANICASGASVDFYIRPNGVGNPSSITFGVGNSISAIGSANVNDEWFSATFSVGSASTLAAKHSGSTTVSVNTITAVTGFANLVWRHMGIACGATSYTLIDYTNSVTQVITPGGVNGGGATGLIFGCSGAGITYCNIDDIVATGLTPAAPTVSATVTQSVAYLVGFDVDPTGNTIIARHGTGVAGQFGYSVKTYAGATLGLTGTTTTFCDRPDGVYASNGHVLYIQCYIGDPTIVASYNIRSSSLTAPGQPSICDGTSFCIMDIPDTALFDGALAGNHDPDREISGFEDFPIDYTNFDETAQDSVYMAFAYTTTAGDVGVVTYVMINNAVDRSDNVIASIGGGQAPDQFCVFRDYTGATAGRTFLYAGSQNSNVQGYEVTFELSGFKSHLIPKLTNVFPGTSSTASPFGVACGDGKFAILNSDKLTVWNRGESAPYITKTGITGVASGGLAMSYDGGWVAYTNASKINMLNTTTGNVTVRLTPPSGLFVGLDMQGHGCAVWEGTEDNIARYDLVGKTCATDLSFIPGGGGSGGNTKQLTIGNNGGGVVAGSGCTQHYDGEIVLGATYVPIADFTNCASMAIETILTCVVLSLLVLIVTSLTKMQGSPLLYVMAMGLGYIGSIYLWQAPGYVVAVAAVLGLGHLWTNRSSGGA